VPARPYAARRPIPSGLRTRVLVPIAAVLPRPLQNLQMPAPSSALTRSLGPRATVLPRPLQGLQVPARSGERTRPSRQGLTLVDVRAQLEQSPGHIHD